MIRELQDIESNWARLLKNTDEQIQRAKKQKIDFEDDVAYTKCVALLDQEYQTQEEKFSKMRRKVKVALQSAQEHIQVCQTQKKQRSQDIQRLKIETQQLQTEETNFGKRVRRKYQIRQKIEEYKKEIEASSVRLQSAKQKSYEQRNLYIETNQLQLKIEDNLNKIEGGQKIYYQFRNREQKYRQLSKIIQKLHNKFQGGNQEIQSYLKEKINEMARLRSQILNLEGKQRQYNNSIEEQEFVIEGLQRRVNQNKGSEHEVFRTYQNKYQKIYFSKNSDLNNWKNYKSYLQDVIKRDKIEPSFRQSELRNSRGTFSHYDPQATFSLQRQHSSLTRTPLTQSNYTRKHSNIRTQPHLSSIEEQEDNNRSRNFINQHSPIHSFNRDLNQIPSDAVRLPKLGRSNVKNYLEAGKIKDNIRKKLNQSNISQQQITSEDAYSGSFMDIDYNKK